ncbi:apolipoprotein D [Daphnia magna]|uniref:Uncharacterized protein n=2 Tax=Daphnia magna TaxID=35525 RepID=A0ABR0AAA5_9CRUS|nr:apolipoprotein D [Daphnia magna]KAK4022069.1 hypothetical protein OUZ56_007556 [Daphnia magna]KZS17319.1 Uncharacterized protein APZ42_016912 [Daphnia magna]
MANNLIQVLLLAACIAGLNAGVVVRSSRGLCPTFTTKPDFDYRQYAGVWYEIEKIPVVFEEGMTCIRAIYDEIAPNTVSVVNTAILADGNATAIYGSAYQPYPDTQPGYLIVQFPGRPDGKYFVLDTDYVTYTAVYDCVDVGAFKLEYAWLMARTNTLTAEQLATARAAYTQFGIDVSIFEATYQSDSCLYIP